LFASDNHSGKLRQLLLMIRR